MKTFVVKVDGIEYSVDVEKLGDGRYKVRIGDKTAEVVVERRREVVRRTVEKTEVKEVKKTVDVKRDLGNVVTAMLPGTIVKILVEVGEHVKAGQALLILEAMKMENEVVSPRDGKVKEIKVKEGARVETGDVLIVIE